DKLMAQQFPDKYPDYEKRTLAYLGVLCRVRAHSMVAAGHIENDASDPGFRDDEARRHSLAHGHSLGDCDLRTTRDTRYRARQSAYAGQMMIGTASNA